MVQRTPLSHLEFEDNPEPSHEVHTILPSLWGRGCPAHVHRIWILDAKGV
jgi:hypothetical protein